MDYVAYQANSQAGHAALSASCCLDAVYQGARLSPSARICIQAAIRDLQLAVQADEANAEIAEQKAAA